ncbi:hypothetical protein NicSoilB4_32190 [Arthrobacter sp. NicSoilB4]|uniref:hypothetical protein n=1 Tax=Arthrobacter sp. NicSoilB4 TaxID=2830997 RepID=UPI001CC427EE|nr:hypothetical protein [Arthrobacter sp. NicSoilB4]BCW68456.1 hypothetical protein NicSoilB4_32190 [Arthrobacter sp. NicSoilB4]
MPHLDAESHSRSARKRMTFGFVLGWGLVLAAIALVAEWGRHVVSGGTWESFQPIAMDKGEVLSALAAVSTGTIALQVMAHGAFSRRSTTLAEFNHRVIVGLLAFLGTAVSWTLAVAVLIAFGKDGKPGNMAYVFVVIVLAGMNSLIGADASDRIQQTESNNFPVMLAEAERVHARYERLRLPKPSPRSRARTYLVNPSHILLLAAIVGLMDTFVAGADWQDWFGNYVVFVMTTAIIQASVAVMAQGWFVPNLDSKLFAPLLLILVLTAFSLIIYTGDSANASGRTAVVLALPTLLFVLSFLTRDSHSRWSLPDWFPGALVREPAARKLHVGKTSAGRTLAGLRLEASSRQPAQARLRPLQFLLTALTGSAGTIHRRASDHWAARGR